LLTKLLKIIIILAKVGIVNTTKSIEAKTFKGMALELNPSSYTLMKCDPNMRAKAEPYMNLTRNETSKDLS
jgi:hypothetical protein